EADSLCGRRTGTNVAGGPDRLPLAAALRAGVVHRVRDRTYGDVSARGEGLRLQALDSAGFRFPFAGIGTGQASDNIVGSSLLDRTPERRSGDSGPFEAGGPGFGPHGSGIETAGPGDVNDLRSHPDRVFVCCRAALEVHRRHSRSGGAGFAADVSFSAGLSEG